MWFQNNGIISGIAQRIRQLWDLISLCSTLIVSLWMTVQRSPHLLTPLTVSCLWFLSEDHKRFDGASRLDPWGPGSRVVLSAASNETALLISSSASAWKIACVHSAPGPAVFPSRPWMPLVASLRRRGRCSIKSSPRWAHIQIYWAAPMEGGGCWKTPECHWT